MEPRLSAAKSSGNAKGSFFRITHATLTDFRARTPSPAPPKSENTRVAGYGVSGDDLLISEYGSESEDDVMSYNRSDDEGSIASSSRSSRPASPVADVTDSRIFAYMRDDDAPESNERTRIVSQGSSSEEVSSKFKAVRNESSMDTAEFGSPSELHKVRRVRMPTIPSLVNTVDIETEQKPDSSSAEAAKNKQDIAIDDEKNSSSKPIFIEDDSEEERQAKTTIILDVDSEDEDTEYDPEAQYESGSEEDEDPDEDAEFSEIEEDSEEDAEGEDEDANEDDVDMITELPEASEPTKEKEVSERLSIQSIVQEPSTPTSPPEELSTREIAWMLCAKGKQDTIFTDGWLTGNFAEAHRSAEACSLPVLNEFPVQTAPVSMKVTPAGGYHTHWSAGTPPIPVESSTAPEPKESTSSVPSYVGLKPTYFQARAENLKTVSERIPPAILRSPANLARWDIAGRLTRIGVSAAELSTDMIDELDKQKDTQPNKSDTLEDHVNPETHELDTSELSNDVSSSTREVHTSPDLDHYMATAAESIVQETERQESAAYPASKRRFEIKDILHRSSSEEAIQYDHFVSAEPQGFVSSYFSPPASEKSGSSCENQEKKSGTNLEDLLNPTATPQASPLKRKRASIESKQSLSRSSSCECEYSSSVLEDNAVERERGYKIKKPTKAPTAESVRPAKRARTEGGPGFFRIVTAAVFGSVFGAAGMFAALVATAE